MSIPLRVLHAIIGGHHARAKAQRRVWGNPDDGHTTEHVVTVQTHCPCGKGLTDDQLNAIAWDMAAKLGMAVMEEMNETTVPVTIQYAREVTA